jgi:hypothetical protein
MIKKLKTKQDFVKALNQSEFKFLEVKRNSQRSGYPCLTDKIKTLICNQKRIHVTIVERVPSKTTP